MPSTRSASAALVVALLALAGCSMPFDAPTDGPAQQAASPPGVESGTLTNVSALLAAHVDSLGASGYRLETATVGVQRMTYVVESNYSSYRVIPGPNSSNPPVWANESLTAARMSSGGETTYQRPPRFWPSRRQMSGADVLGAMFQGADFDRAGTAACGDRTCVVLSATNHSRYAAFEAKAVVDGSGVVRRFDAAYTLELENRTITNDYRHRVVRTGNVSVERPSWVETAIKRTS